MPKLPDSVKVVEVGPRDGLQNEKDLVPVEAKVAFVDALGAAGIREIEVTSFVSPKAVPQLADAAEVVARVDMRRGTRYSVLVANMKGLERWLDSAPLFEASQRSIALFTAASETFNRKNTNAGVDESLETFGEVVRRLRNEMPTEMPFLRGYVSTAVRCPYEGPIAPDKVAALTRRLFDVGLDEVSLGDTIGAASPMDIERLLDAVLASTDRATIALHLHDTRGTALANVLTALQRGISIFDSSAGGLGGCPFAPGAAGNLATEDLVYMLDGMDIHTGVDLAKVADASDVIRPFIDHPLPSKELQALRSAGF